MGRAQKLKQQRKEEQAKQEKEERKKVYRTVIIVVASILLIAATVALVFLVNKLKEEEGKPPAESTSQMVLETSKGEIVIDLLTRDTPITVDHVTSLVEQGFYDNLLWYRVEDFVVQTGSHYQSLLAETGEGEPDQAKLEEAMLKDQQTGTLVDEIGQSNVRGAVGMAKPNDPETQLPMANSARTDFYILKQDALGLDQYFTVFGRVVEGMEVVDSLETTDYLISAQIREK